MEKEIKLTKEQDKFWIDVFSGACCDGLNDKQADKKAFKETIKAFPHLKNCRGFK